MTTARARRPVRVAARRFAALMVFVFISAARAFAQAPSPVEYVVTFPAPEHHWMQVAVTFRDLGTAPLKARMSRSSPGRYSMHEFAKNIFAIDAADGAGRPLKILRADADEWDVAAHDGTVRLVYRIFGDYADGTYLGIDTSHAHLNMPAAFIWAVGFDDRPIRIRFDPPPALHWKVATQLFPTGDASAFTAPNLQYFMDSPTELSNFLTASFTLPNANSTTARFRVVVHGADSQTDVDDLAKLIERLVREEMAVYGEFPSYEPGQYTFLLDYVPWGQGDGMEHRNSTTISQPGLSIATRDGQLRALETVAHEFFHNWNVERIRPAGLEPFDLTRENVTCCLWLAEGFTQYYGPLLLERAGLGSELPMTGPLAVMSSSARSVHSAVEMSENAPFADASVENDVDDRNRTFLDYYTFGSAIALGLDLSLRELSHGSLSLDDYMRKLWQDFGKPADARPGYVARPYTLTDLRDELASLTSNRAFANDFFDRYVEGRDAIDYTRVLAPAGYVVRPYAPTRGWIGDVPVRDTGAGLSVGDPVANEKPVVVPFGTPLYDAGVDEGDLITTIDGRPASAAAWDAIGQKKPGETVALKVRRRDGSIASLTATLKADPRVAILPIEATGATLTAEMRAFRVAWLGTKVR